MSEDNYLIAGLGNPGSKYETTRHNIGFLVVDALAERHGSSVSSEKWDALHCRITIGSKRIYLLKPQSYMNRSGAPIAKFADYYKVPKDQILVIHDDLDMHPGRLKLVTTGGPGGHNGIRSTIQHLGTKDFSRLKIGIGRPGQNGVHPEIPVDRFVLSALSDEELKLLDERLETLLDGVEDFIAYGSQKAMNRLNSVK